MARQYGYFWKLIGGILGMLIGVFCIMVGQVALGLVLFLVCLFVARQGYVKRQAAKTTGKEAAASSGVKKKKADLAVKQKVESVFRRSPKPAPPAKSLVPAREKIKYRDENRLRLYQKKVGWSANKRVAVFVVVVVVLCIIGYALGAGIAGRDSSRSIPTDGSSLSKNGSSSTPSKSKCGNGVKDSGETCSSCPQDVKCKSGYTCVSGTCKKKSYCGDGLASTGETCSSCPSDVKCPTGKKCVSGKCVIPEIEYEFKVYAVTPMSTGVMYHNQDFYETFTNSSWGKVVVIEKGDQKLESARLIIDFGNWANKITKTLGDISTSKTVYINPKLTTSALVKSQTTKQAKFTLEFYDNQNKKQTKTITKNIVLLPSQYVSMRVTMFSLLYSEQKYKAFLQFHDSRIKALAQDWTQGVGSSNEARAKAIYNALAEAGLKYKADLDKDFQLTYFTSSGEKTETSNFDHIKFPYQTYSEEGGDCEDLAILMCSLLQSIDIDSYLLFTKDEDSAHSFLSFEGDAGSTVKLEATLIGKNSYQAAVRSGTAKYEEYRDKWLSSIIVRDAFKGEGIRKLPVW